MIRLSSRQLSRHGVQIRLIKLLLFCSPILGAYWYGYTNSSSPFSCLFKMLIGIPCPGYGMTRSLMAIARGHWLEAISYNLIGLVLVLVLSIATLHLLLELLLQRQIEAFYSSWIQKKRLHFWVVMGIIGYHTLRLCLWLHSGELAISFQQSLLAKLLV